MCRAQVGEKVHLFAQAQQAALWLYREIQIVVFWTTNSTQQYGVHFERAGHRVVVQRRAVFVVRRAADQIVFHVKGQISLCTEPVDDAGHLAHNLGADAVTGKDKKGWVGHAALLSKIC